MKAHLRIISGLAILIIFVMLTMHSATIWPSKHPSTTKILTKKESFEGINVLMRGKVSEIKTSEEEIRMILDSYGKTFEAKISPKKQLEYHIQKGDIVDILGKSYLSTKGFVDVQEFLPRSEERHNMLFILSGVGIVLFILLALKDFKIIKELLFNA
jgi:transcription antitermination factor NusG